MRTYIMVRSLVLSSLCLFIFFGQSNVAFGSVEQEKALNAIQEQIIALRKEFKLRVAQAEEDRQAVYTNIQQKLKELIDIQNSLNRSQPEIVEKVEQLLPELQKYQTQIDSLEQTLDTLENTMHSDLDSLEAQFSTAKHDAAQGSIRRPLPVAPEESSEPSEEQEPDPLGELSQGKLFRLAYQFFMEGEYEVAIGGFQKFLTEYPDSQLAGAAQYWIAESFARLDEYDIAIQEYTRLLKSSPKDDKTADAHYGIGVAQLKLGNAEEARTKFMYVVEHFGGTIAASKAQRRLEEFR